MRVSCWNQVTWGWQVSQVDQLTCYITWTSIKSLKLSLFSPICWLSSFGYNFLLLFGVLLACVMKFLFKFCVYNGACASSGTTWLWKTHNKCWWAWHPRCFQVWAQAAEATQAVQVRACACRQSGKYQNFPFNRYPNFVIPLVYCLVMLFCYYLVKLIIDQGEWRNICGVLFDNMRFF